MKWTLRQKITVISLLVCCSVLAIYLLSKSYDLRAKALASFDPADYGLPSQIGGYQVMVAIPWESQGCAPPNQLQLMLYALPDQAQTLTTADIKQLEAIVNRPIQLSFSSGIVSIEQVKSQMKEWNVAIARGCDRIGGPMVTLPRPVPTLVPTREAGYDPADYHLPPEIGGYQVTAVMPWKTKFCNPSNDIELFLYAIPNQPQTLTTADIQTLKDLAHRPIQLMFTSSPVSIEELKSRSNEFNAISCVNLGGPMPDTPTSDAS